MLRIGLTGGIGSGKSTVANYFAELGAPVIDADQIAHEITKPDQAAFKQIINHFGNAVLTKGKFLNRTKLRELIFENPDDRQWLENLLHPLIIAKMKTQLKKNKSALLYFSDPFTCRGLAVGRFYRPNLGGGCARNAANTTYKIARSTFGSTNSTYPTITEPA